MNGDGVFTWLEVRIYKGLMLLIKKQGYRDFWPNRKIYKVNWSK